VVAMGHLTHRNATQSAEGFVEESAGEGHELNGADRSGRRMPFWGLKKHGCQVFLFSGEAR